MKSPAFPLGINTNVGSLKEKALPFSPIKWTSSLPNLMPNRLRRKIRSRMRNRRSPSGAALSKLNTSFNPKDTLRALRAHRWSVYDSQYLLLMLIAVFCLSIMQASALFKTFMVAMLMLTLILPITRQFFLPFLPIATWLLLFFCSR